jgi:hypothetical protein
LKQFLLSLLILSIALNTVNASSYGYSRIKMEREWIVDGANGTPIDFQGALSANNSFQRIISLSTEPQMTQEVRDGIIWVSYAGTPTSDHLVLKATVIADVDYDPHILSDSPVPGTKLNYTNLTEPDDGISKQAHMLERDGSSLETIRALTEWVHKNVTYDISYWGKTKSARETFVVRRGVCVEYTHLLIAMARSLGFDTRYVSGYIYVNGWQQHAWAEIFVPGYGWLPADATFGQVGIMDDTHFAIHYAADQSATFDTLTSTSTAVNLDAKDTPSVLQQGPEEKGIAMSFSMDARTYIFDVTLNNSRPEYVYGAYSFQVPQSYGADNDGIILLHPNQEQHLFHAINSSFFESGLTYKVPVSISFNDVMIQKDIQIEGKSPQITGTDTGSTSTQPSACPSYIILLLIPCIMALRGPDHRIWR